jgi:hypothetical protein
MGVNTAAKGESGSEISNEDTVLLHLSHNCGVDGLLLSDEFSWERLLGERGDVVDRSEWTYLLLAVSEELFLSLLATLLGFLGLLERGVSDLVSLDGGHVQLSGGSNNVSSVESSQRNSVNLVWT